MRPLWLVPLFSLLIILAPLWRDGLPLTQFGLLPIAASVADVAHLNTPLIWNVTADAGTVGYRLYLLTGVVVAMGVVLFVAHTLWGGFSWWTAALWVSLPLTLSFVYQRGWFPFMAFAPFFWAMLLVIPINSPSRRWVWIMIVGASFLFIVSLELRWPHEAALSPYQWFSAAWPAPTNTREWVGQLNYQLGLVPVVLGVLTAFAAWPRRHEAVARRALILLAIASGAVLLTLLGGAVLLALFVGTTALVLACGALPVLDRRYASVPVLLGLLAAALLSIYPYLQVAWVEPPITLTPYRFRSDELWLAQVNSHQVGEQITITATWQSLSRPPQDYTAFVHFVDAEGNLLVQADTLLIDSDEVPTSGWPSGYIVEQTYTATVPEGYSEIRLGLYELETLDRLTVTTFPPYGPPWDYVVVPSPTNVPSQQ